MEEWVQRLATNIEVSVSITENIVKSASRSTHPGDNILGQQWLKRNGCMTNDFSEAAYPAFLRTTGKGYEKGKQKLKFARSVICCELGGHP